MKKLGFCLLLSVILSLLGSACWAGEPLWVAVKGENVNIREKPNTKAKVIEQVNGSEGSAFIVDSATITDKASGLTWYRILYSVDEMDESTYYERGSTYIAAKFVKARQLTAGEKQNLQFEAKRIAEDKVYRKTGAWKITEFTEGSEIYTQNEKIKSVPIYADSSLKSQKITDLPVNTPVLISAAKFRYVKATDNNEGWIKITKPVIGWVPLEFIGLAYSEFFVSSNMMVW